ncbi:MAG TPA: PAS domain S-box protein, partial [Pseudomonadales bacterium]|nr:PAS domain S-box protein [Pseudomonadales bacterium]
MRVRAAEQKIKEYTRQYENLYNFAPVGYFTLGRDGLIQKANIAWAKLLGIPGEELIQRSFGAFIPVPFRTTFSDFLNKVFTSRNKETCDVALHGDGTGAQWVQIQAILDSGETCQAVVSDITARSQNEDQRDVSVNALRESEERLAFVLEGSQLGYWDWNIETGAVQRNERWAEMLGYTLDEIELNVKQWTDLQHPDDRAAAWKSLQDHLDGRTPMHKAEYRMLTKSGEYKWILDCAKVVKRDAQGHPLRMSGTHTDITERKQADAALQAEKANLDAIFESSPVAMFILDNETNIVKLNAAAVLMTGSSASEALKRRPGDALHCIHS